MPSTVFVRVANHVHIKLYACWTLEAEEDVPESTELHLKSKNFHLNLNYILIKCN